MRLGELEFPNSSVSRVALAERIHRYANGVILIAKIEPNFTILNTLNTSRVTCPIVNIAWHASSSKQRSDMLATQAANGDLKVWSIAKDSSRDQPPKIVRTLNKMESSGDIGANWMAWSKNGRIIQFSEG